MSYKFNYQALPKNMPYMKLINEEPSINCPFCHSFSGQNLYIMHQHNIKPDIDHLFNSLDIDSRNNEAENDHNEMLKSIDRPELEIDFELFLEKEGYILCSNCRSCKKTSIWYKGEFFEELLFPKNNSINLIPNKDLSSEAQKDFNEAISVLDFSPRSSAALARLTLEKMLKDLNIEGNDINKKIQTLVDGGLSPTIQQSLDIVRVIGNNAVHPGKMDITDDKDTATTILTLINVIAETLITIPKQVNSVYMTLPESSRKSIENRKN